MSTQSFEPLQINSPVESTMTTSPSTDCQSMNESHQKNKIINDFNENVDNSQKQYNCGWYSFRPKFLQRLMSAKWALFWLCWAGAVQGNFLIF